MNSEEGGGRGTQRELLRKEEKVREWLMVLMS